MPKIPFVKEKIKSDPDGNAVLFEEVLYQKELLIKRVYGWVAVIGILFGLLSLIALIVMLPLKRVDTRIFMVDGMTGAQEEIVNVKGGELSENSALARFFVQKYISWREGYNYFRLQQDYDTVLLYSNDAVGNEYNQLFKGDNKDNPKNIYHKGEQTAQITVLSKMITDSSKEVAIKWSAAPDMTPQTVLYRRPVAQFSNFQPKIVSSWLILALFQANFLISGRSRLCPYQLVNSNQVRQGE
ncbi:hypothetical protein EZJ11_24270 (plasmid) [Enterobacter hormaechei]|nr:hypothetical protein EZJ11_24270 [Enterobacter hormaechei]